MFWPIARTCASAANSCCPALARPLSCPVLASFWPCMPQRRGPRPMNAPAYVTRLILPALAIALASAGAAPAAPAPDKVFLAPHRAVYDLKLSKSHGGRSIEAVRGRILYDFSGNACDGYALQFRQVSELEPGRASRRSATCARPPGRTPPPRSSVSIRRTCSTNTKPTRSTAMPSASRGGLGQLEQAEGEDIHRAGQCRVPDRAYAPHHHRGARGKKHPGVSGL